MLTRDPGTIINTTPLNPSLGYRATPVAPDGYTPQSNRCPSSRPAIREASALSQQETDWLALRRKQTVPAMQSFLARLNITGFDVNGYFSSYSNNDSALPNIGIAASGGGYRACLTGAGAIQAFDSREANSSASGQLGGLLDSATYLSGLSGGGWLVGSIFVNNYSTISNLLDDGSTSVWHFDNSVIEGPDTRGPQILSTADYYGKLFSDVHGKSDDFETTLTDYWGRALSFQLVSASDGGPAYTWSSIANDSLFASAKTPLPLLVSDERLPGQLLIPGNTTVYEFSPWEFGSWDPTTYGFAPLQYLGTNFSNGAVSDDSSCVTGFDNAGFVMGTSSSLFNDILLGANVSTFSSLLNGALQAIVNDVGGSNEDIADYSPNPFFGYNPTGMSPNADQTSLTMVDGGEDLQNIPLHPLIQPSRNVDVIFAIDSSADTNTHWPNGTSLVATYGRSLNASGIANGTAFPSVPDVNTMVNLGLNAKPSFFGCDASNSSGPTPLVVYIPNAPYNFFSNVSTFNLSYTDSQRNAIVANGHLVATQANSSAWGTCVGCAVLSRSFGRTNTPVPQACQSCFNEYCWNGTLNATVPEVYSPGLREGEASVNSGAVGSLVLPSISTIAVGALVVSWVASFA